MHRDAPRGSGDDPVESQALVVQVESIRGLVENGDVGLGVEFAREQHLLDVAAGELADRREFRRRADVVAQDLFAGAAVDQLPNRLMPCRQYGGAPISLSTRFVATEKVPTVPSPSRSSVT